MITEKKSSSRQPKAIQTKSWMACGTSRFERSGSQPRAERRMKMNLLELLDWVGIQMNNDSLYFPAIQNLDPRYSSINVVFSFERIVF